MWFVHSTRNCYRLIVWQALGWVLGILKWKKQGPVLVGMAVGGSDGL